MTDVLICGMVFSFLIICVYLDYSGKKSKQKIEAALRMEEMKRGYKPGTYSYKFNKRNLKRAAKEFDRDFQDNTKVERVELKDGIEDLMARINNLETIMKSEEEK